MVAGARASSEVPSERDAGESAFTFRLKSGEGPAETQDGVRASSSGRPIVTRCKARDHGAVADRGRKGHRNPRRVLVGGRPLGSSRAISFHERMVTSTLAASSRRVAATLARAEAGRSGEGAPHPAQEEEATEESEARSVCWRRGKKTPTLRAHARGRETVRRAERQHGKRVVQQRSAEAFASVVKHSVPRSIARSPRLRGSPRDRAKRESAERAGNARGTGTRQSFRWQKSVRRIARLALRPVARPGGHAGR